MVLSNKIRRKSDSSGSTKAPAGLRFQPNFPKVFKPDLLSQTFRPDGEKYAFTGRTAVANSSRRFKNTGPRLEQDRKREPSLTTDLRWHAKPYKSL